MSHIAEANLNARAEFDFLLIVTGMEETDSAKGVCHGIERYVFFHTGTFAFPVTPFCLEFLDVCTVAKHNAAQITGGKGGNDVSMESVLI